MKKSIFLIVSCFVLLSLIPVGCNEYNGKYPYDFIPSKWVSDSPNAVFWVNSETGVSPKGEIILPESKLCFTVSFGYSTYASFTDDNNNILFAGECEFSSEKLTVKIDKETDTVFMGKYENIVFLRSL